MADNPTPTRGEEKRLIKERHFRSNAFLIIDEMLNLSPQHPVLMDEVLHSIFFLAKINIPPFRPGEIVDNDVMLNALMDRYPEPFKQYTTKLPRRSPISCVLDMIVSLSEPEDENTVKQRLHEFIDQLNSKPAQLVSSAICVSQANTNPDSKRYYGVSMSTSGPIPGQIMIAASCLSTYWDSYVADAVMTFYPNKVKKTYFDGTFTLPQQVKCQAFNISDRSPMPPCKSCKNLFGLTTNETTNNETTKNKTREWPYGNCAECESVSNLLKNEQRVRENVHPVSDANREIAKAELLKKLRSHLRMVGFTKNKRYEPTFYVPQ